MSEAVSKFSDGTNKTAAMQTLGRGMAELIPLLDEGAEHMRDLAKEASDSGAVLDTETTGALANMEHGFKSLGLAIKGDAVSAFAPFVGVVDGAAA